MNQVIVTSKDELENIILLSIRKVFFEKENSTAELDQDKIFSIKEACTFLNLAQQTLYGFTSRREIPFIKRGKKLYFRKSELKNWLLEGKKKSKKELSDENN
jgi:excisionase family DNA binding protein